MKKLFKYVFNFFNAYFKLDKIEHSICSDLEQDYIDYQKSPDIDKLHRLMILVSFCQRNNINGRTTKIQETISEEWQKQTLSKNNTTN